MSRPRHVMKNKGDCLQSRELFTTVATQSNGDLEEYITTAQWHRFRQRSNTYFDGHQPKFGLNTLPKNFQWKKMGQSRPRKIFSLLPVQSTSDNQSSFSYSEPDISRLPIECPLTLHSNIVAPELHEPTEWNISATPSPRRQSNLYFDLYGSSFGKLQDALSMSCRDVDDRAHVVAPLDRNSENGMKNKKLGIVKGMHGTELTSNTRHTSEPSEGEELEEKLNLCLRQTFGPQSEPSLDISINYDYFVSAN